MPALDGLLLEEAQLSWGNGLLRVAATEGGVRWFACSTRSPASRRIEPDWEMPPEPAEASSYQVYLRSDLARFLGRRTQDGELVEPEPPPAARRSVSDWLRRRQPATPYPFRINGQVASITVVEWRQGAEVMAWWLIPTDLDWESEL